MQRVAYGLMYGKVTIVGSWGELQQKAQERPVSNSKPWNVRNSQKRGSFQLAENGSTNHDNCLQIFDIVSDRTSGKDNERFSFLRDGTEYQWHIASIE